MRKKLSVFASLVLAVPALLLAATLPATVVGRVGSPADNLNRYNNGGFGIDKGTIGQTKEGNVHFKSLIIFDVVSKIEELAQNPEAKLKMPINWVKSADHVQDVHIYLVGAKPKANFNNADLWQIVPSGVGTKVATIPAHELAPIAKGKGQAFELDLTGKIPSGVVTPVNRYLVFRVESMPFPAGGNGLLGVPNDPTKISLVIGSEDSAGSAAGYGGY